MSLRLVGVTRVSTGKQLDKGASIPSQKRGIREWAHEAGHMLVEIADDGAVTGTADLGERVGLKTALQMIRDGLADGIVIRDLDRLARSLTHQEAHLAMVWKLGGRVFCYQRGEEVLPDDPTDPFRTAMRQMMGVFAQLERSIIINRMKDGRAEKAAKGGYAYGSPPFGTRSEDKELVANHAEQQTIARIRELRRDGLTIREIVAHLNQATEHKPRRSKRWAVSSVGKIVKRLETAA